jgi:hypothetical protein
MKQVFGLVLVAMIACSCGDTAFAFQQAADPPQPDARPQAADPPYQRPIRLVDEVSSQVPEHSSSQAPNGGTSVPQGRVWTSMEIILSCLVILMTITLFWIEANLINGSKDKWDPQSILRLFGLTLIIMSSLMLITAGYSNTQVAPVVGLLGTMAGYLLGARDGKT